MKKYMTVAALLVAGAAFANAEKVESGSYTLKMDNWTTGDATLYNFLNGAINEGGTLVFDLDINYTGTNCGAYQTLLHVGQKGTGFSIYANGGPNIIVSEKHATDSSHEFSAPTLATGDNDVKITIEGNKTAGTAKVSLSINGTVSQNTVTDLSWSSMEWNTSGDEHAKYSVNYGAPGWSNLTAAQTTTLKAGTATFTAIPEPSAFGLLAGLGALALVGARRRRR